MARFRSQYNPGETKAHWYETNTKPSKTIPGEALTIQEIFRKSVEGTLHQPDFEPQYFHVDDVDKVTRWNRPLTDLTDLDDLAEYNRQALEHVDQVTRQIVENEKAMKAKKLAEAKQNEAAEKQQQEPKQER